MSSKRTDSHEPRYSPEYASRCAEAVDVALEETPAYRSWRPLDPGPSAEPLERVAALPWLTKADLRSHGAAGFVPAGKSLEQGLAAGEVELVETSGSTGDRVSNVWYQPWWDASERASWRLNDRSGRARLGEHREVILTSPLCAGVVREDGYVTREERTLGRFLYLNERSDPTTWTEEHMDRMVRELRSFRPAVVEANPSFLARLSRHILRRGLRPPEVELVVFTYENPSLLHYRDVSRAFVTSPASSYGSTEAGYVFMECEAGRLHQNTQFCHVDFLPFRGEHGGPEVGRILVTTFGNPWRSLVRFDIGDIVRLEASGSCPCGRGEGLVLSGIEGRTVNITLTPDGRAVTQAAVDRALCEVDGLIEYQLLQTDRRSYELRFAAPEASRARSRAGRDASERLHAIYGRDASIRLEPVDDLPPDPPGKYRLTKSLLALDGSSLVEPACLRSPN